MLEYLFLCWIVVLDLVLSMLVVVFGHEHIHTVLPSARHDPCKLSRVVPRRLRQLASWHDMTR